MRDALDANWDRAVDLVIAEEGITVHLGGSRTDPGRTSR